MEAREQELLQLKLAAPMARRVKREINRYINTISILYNQSSSAISNDYHFAEHKQNLKEIFNYYVLKAIRAFGSKTTVNTKQKRTLDWWHIRNNNYERSFFDFLFTEYLKLNAGQDIVGIAETTREMIRDVIIKETTNEITTQGIAKKILAVKGFSAFRAQTIAITEIGKAGSFSSFETANQIGIDNNLVLKKKWIPVADERTRINHAAMLGKPAIPMNEPFIVGGERMMRPRDTNASAGNIIRCRCALVYEE